MWFIRDDAPIAYLSKPSSGHWFIETDIEVLTPEDFLFHAGLTVYEDSHGAVPAFTYALSNWLGPESRHVILQGLDDDNPNVSVPATAKRITLRLEVREDPGGQGPDHYTFLFDLKDGRGMQTLTTHRATIDNSRAGIYLKSRQEDGVRSVAFHRLKIGPIAPEPENRDSSNDETNDKTSVHESTPE